MKVEIVIDKDSVSPRLVLYTAKLTPELEQLVSRLSEEKSGRIIGFMQSEAFLLDREEIYSFYCEGQKVYARTGQHSFRVKERLYELEEQLAGSTFVRISNSEIANFRLVSSLDMGLSGTITVRYKDGVTTYVSRRNIEKIKKYLGL